MTISERLFASKRLVMTTVALLTAAGVLAWAVMPRQEDPSMPERWGSVLVFYPGADAPAVERLVLVPIEERLAEVDEVLHVESTARAGLASLLLQLGDGVDDTNDAWDRVQRALDRARAELPEAATAPQLDLDGNDTESVLLALTGPVSEVELGRVARQVKREILSLEGVKRVSLAAEPGEQITVELDDGAARRAALDPRLLAAQLQSRNVSLPGGSILADGRVLVLRPESELRSVDELAETPIMLPSGAAIPLSDIATVRFGPQEPRRQTMRLEGRPAVAIGVVPAEEIDVVVFGERVREMVAVISENIAPLELHEVAFQPEHVRDRLEGLGLSLAIGILVVAAVLLFFMGPRLGLVVSSVVPLVAFSSLALFAIFGGVLHQISVAALVIALGLLVDNAIVVAESVQRRLEHGEAPGIAGIATVRELAVPLGTATATTVAAFVPMLLSQGPTADFTRALPIVIILTLGVSYAFAVAATPVLAATFLRSKKNVQVDAETRPDRWQVIARRIAHVPVRRPWWVLLCAVALVVASISAASQVRTQFFPASDRPLVIVDLEMPVGAHVDQVDAAARRLEEILAQRDDVVSVTTFVGRGAPTFYYNLHGGEHLPNIAQIVVRTGTADAVLPTAAFIRSFARQKLPQVSVVARRLEQGPPVGAPVEVRLYGPSLPELEAAASAVLAEVRSTPGATDASDSLGTGAPTALFEVNDVSASRFRISRSDVALALLGQTRGLHVGTFRGGDDPVPIVIRASAGERMPPSLLASVDVGGGPGTQPIPLDQVATFDLEWRPGSIERRDGERVVTVSAQLDENASYSEILASLRPRLDGLDLPEGVLLEMGGEAEGSGEANGALLRTLPVGALLLVFFLLLEFNSFRRVGIILTTVPFAAVGVIPGLLLSDQPFGFMSLLGVIALLGVVVNNAIVLVDVLDRRLAAGLPLPLALAEAVERRFRPILLTTATTVAGLSPLALSSSPLWPPLAWAMISGLVASTLLTLLVVPALCRLLLGFKPSQMAGWIRLGGRVETVLSRQN